MILILAIITVFVYDIAFSNNEIVQAKTSKNVKGKDGNGIAWTYNKKTKTLTFKGKGDMEEFIMNGHNPEPDWYCWNEETEHVVIEEGITNVTGYAFYDFTNVKTVYFADSVTKIGELAFYSCMGLQKIHLSKNITKIDDYVFFDCKKLKKVTIPAKVKHIGKEAFSFCESLSEVKVPDCTKYIGEGAFYGCKNLKSIQLSKYLKTIHADLFGECSKLKSITIPQSVETICDGAFYKSGMEKITIPKNVTRFKCDGFGNGLFDGCPNLTKVVIKSKKLSKCYENAFYGFPDEAVIYVPEGKKKEYRKLFRDQGLEQEVKVKEIEG